MRPVVQNLLSQNSEFIRLFGTRLDENVIDNLIRTSGNKIEKLPELVNKYIQNRLEVAYQQEAAARLMQEAANSGFTVNQILCGLGLGVVFSLFAALYVKQLGDLRQINDNLYIYTQVLTGIIQRLQKNEGTTAVLKSQVVKNADTATLLKSKVGILTVSTLDNTNRINATTGFLNNRFQTDFRS